jgi:hypothetical protein
MPGSPQALDPGEPGPHGPWLASVEGSRIGTPVQQPLSAVWYDELAIDAGPAADETALETLILDALRQRADVISRQAGEDLHYIGARLRLTGASPLADRVYAIAERLRQDLRIASRNSVLGVDTIACDVTPRLDLAEQARMPTLPGGIARLLQELDRPEAPSAGVADLLRSARQAIEQAENSKEFALFERRPLDDNRLRELLRLQAHALLTQLARPPA